VQLDRYYEKISQAGIDLYAVSVDPPETSRRLKQRLNSRFTFLCDTEGVLLDALNIRHRDGLPGRDIAYPTAVLVDSKGIVRWTYETDTYRRRARPEEILQAVGDLG
jgi:peroxiredoxin